MDLNNSQLQDILSCGVRWEFRYVKNIQAAPSFEMARGTLLHKVRQQNFKAKKSCGLDMSEEEAIEVGRVAQVDLEYRRSTEGLDMAKTIQAGVVLDRERFWRGIKPLFVEEKIMIRPQGWDVKIYGTLDLLTQDGRLIDLKTVSARKKPEVAHNSTQLSLYTMLPRQYGVGVRSQEIQYLVFNRYKVSAEAHQTTREPADLEAALLKIQRAVSLIKAGIILPAPDGAWYCSPRWCQFYQLCPFVTKAAKLFAIGGIHESSPSSNPAPATTGPLD